MIFEVQVSHFSHDPTFSPDSSYFLCGSIRSCVCIRKQKEVAFIPGGPENIKHCSFSSCGKKLVTAEENFLKVWNVEKRELLAQVEKRYDDFDRCYFSSCNNYVLEQRPSFLFVRDSATLEKIHYAGPKKCLEECLGSNQITYLVDDRIGVTSYYHFSDNEAVEIAPVESFTWRNRRCLILSCSSTLIIYDFINREVIDRFQIDCLPAYISINSISKLDGTNFLLCLDEIHIIILSLESLETPEESSVVSYAFPYTSPRVTLSPDHLHVVCCYDRYNVLTIRRVDNGETLETVQLQKPPKAFGWSELYLWLVCEGALFRFPYNSTHSNVLGSGREVCPLTSGSVLGFDEGVFVFKENDNIITILKVSDDIFFINKIGDLPFGDAAISKDGCAVLLYDKIFEQYQLLEFTPESRWELHSCGTIGEKFRKFQLRCLSLTGTQNCRKSICMGFELVSDKFTLFSLDFSSKEVCECSLPYGMLHFLRVLYVAPNFLLIKASNCLSVLNVSDNKIIATLPFCAQYSDTLFETFYLSSDNLLLVVFANDIKYFRIHNLENCLKS